MIVQFGVFTSEQYERAAKYRRRTGSGISLNLLQVSDQPSDQEILRFEEISAALRTSMGTARTTFRQRMLDVDEVALHLIEQSFPLGKELKIQDRAASNCVTSAEWAKQLFATSFEVHFEASDRLLYLLRILRPDGSMYFMEPGGQLLQYVKKPFVVCLYPRESYRYPLNQIVAVIAKRSFRGLFPTEGIAQPMQIKGHRIAQISCIHPEAHSLMKADPRFSICERSVFDRTPGLDVLRAMNILNIGYFSRQQLEDGIEAAFESLKANGVWIVGRTLPENRTNHVTFFRRTENGWEVLARIGTGSEIEKLIISRTSVL